jgi:hypothetical protein
MDALTNVVAVLILVLLLVQADVTRKVEQFLEDLQPASQEQVEQARKQLEDAVAKKESIDRKLLEDAPTPEKVAEEKQLVLALERDLGKNDELLAELKQLKELEVKARKERDSENEATLRIQEEIAKLEALLDQTPVLQDLAPTEVTIPNSRPIPPKAVVYHAIAIKDRVHMIDPHAPLKLFEEEFKKYKRDWLVERIKRQGSDRYIYDSRKIAAHFKNFDFRNTRGQKVEVLVNPVSTQVQLAITPDLVKGGTAIDDLEKPGTDFSKTAGLLMGDIRSVLLFHVNPDSFNAYLKARRLIDKTKVSAGWQVSGSTSHRIVIPDLEVERLETPPPAPPAPKPKRPQPIGPKLD